MAEKKGKVEKLSARKVKCRKQRIYRKLKHLAGELPWIEAESLVDCSNWFLGDFNFMASTSEITISLNRTLNADDEWALTYLMSQWLVYDVRINRHRRSAEIHLFHTLGAKPDLVRELTELFPNEHMTGM